MERPDYKKYMDEESGWGSKEVNDYIKAQEDFMDFQQSQLKKTEKSRDWNINQLMETRDEYINKCESLESKLKERDDAIKEIAHISDKYCCCTACKVAKRLNLKN